jgi:hypothetical protein
MQVLVAVVEAGAAVAARHPAAQAEAAMAACAARHVLVLWSQTHTTMQSAVSWCMFVLPITNDVPQGGGSRGKHGKRGGGGGHAQQLRDVPLPDGHQLTQQPEEEEEMQLSDEDFEFVQQQGVGRLGFLANLDVKALDK